MPLNDSIGLLAAGTALVAATYRYATVLAPASDALVERWTAIGFFTGPVMAERSLVCSRPGIRLTVMDPSTLHGVGSIAGGAVAGLILGITMRDASPALLLIAVAAYAVVSAFVFVRLER